MEIVRAHGDADDCEETCRVNHAGETFTECAEKCSTPREACERKRCNPK